MPTLPLTSLLLARYGMSDTSCCGVDLCIYSVCAESIAVAEASFSDGDVRLCMYNKDSLRRRILQIFMLKLMKACQQGLCSFVVCFSLLQTYRAIPRAVHIVYTALAMVLYNTNNLYTCSGQAKRAEGSSSSPATPLGRNTPHVLSPPHLPH